jgi:hypothetical protein
MNQRDTFIAAFRHQDREEREHYLDRTCGDDHSYRPRIESLPGLADTEGSSLVQRTVSRHKFASENTKNIRLGDERTTATSPSTSIAVRTHSMHQVLRTVRNGESRPLVDYCNSHRNLPNPGKGLSPIPEIASVRLCDTLFLRSRLPRPTEHFSSGVNICETTVTFECVVDHEPTYRIVKNVIPALHQRTAYQGFELVHAVAHSSPYANAAARNPCGWEMNIHHHREAEFRILKHKESLRVGSHSCGDFRIRRRN